MAETAVLNPWLSMWTKPRSTVQWLIERDPARNIVLLPTLAALSDALNRASSKGLGDTSPLPLILVMALVTSVIFGPLMLYLGSIILGWTGKWLGGRASREAIGMALAWSMVPIAWSLLLWIPELLIFGTELFSHSAPSVAASPLLFLSFKVAEAVLGCWALVLLLKSLGQVQGFSAWRALGTTLLGLLILVVPIVLLVFAFKALF